MDLDHLMKELRAAVSLGGRIRQTANPADRASRAVARVIRLAIKNIGQSDPDLAGHLQSRVIKGTSLVYRGDGIPWNS